MTPQFGASLTVVNYASRVIVMLLKLAFIILENIFSTGVTDDDHIVQATGKDFN